MDVSVLPRPIRKLLLCLTRHVKHTDVLDDIAGLNNTLLSALCAQQLQFKQHQDVREPGVMLQMSQRDEITFGLMVSSAMISLLGSLICAIFVLYERAANPVLRNENLTGSDLVKKTWHKNQLEALRCMHAAPTSVEACLIKRHTRC